MPTAKNEVKLKFGTKANYTSATKNADTVYFITDTNQIYIGNKLVSSKAYSGSSAPMVQQYDKGDIYLYTPANGDPMIYVHNGVGFSIVNIPITDITANTNARHLHTNKETLDAISGTPVQVTSQTLTDAQKTQARTNIGALGTVVPNPTKDNDAANKAYVDSKVASVGVTADSSMSDTSVNPVQNKVIKKYIDDSYDVKVTITRTGNAEPYSYQADKDYNYVLSQINKGCNVYAYCTWTKGIVQFYQISDSISSIVFRQYTSKYTILIFLKSSNQVEYSSKDNKLLTYKEQNLSDDDKLQARTNIDVMSSQEVSTAIQNAHVSVDESMSNTSTHPVQNKVIKKYVDDHTVVDSTLSETSTNPVQNKVITKAMAGKLSTSGGVMTGMLTTKGIKLTKNVDYNNTPPSNPVEGQLFFQTANNLVLDMVHPVGSIYMSLNATSPSALFGGTWEQIKDRFLLAAGNNYPAEAIGGEAAHALTIEELAKHTHLPDEWTVFTTAGGTLTSGAAAQTSSGIYEDLHNIRNKNLQNTNNGASETIGGGLPNNNIPQYLAVYMWKRTA